MFIIAQWTKKTKCAEYLRSFAKRMGLIAYKRDETAVQFKSSLMRCCVPI